MWASTVIIKLKIGCSALSTQLHGCKKVITFDWGSENIFAL